MSELQAYVSIKRSEQREKQILEEMKDAEWNPKEHLWVIEISLI